MRASARCGERHLRTHRRQRHPANDVHHGQLRGSYANLAKLMDKLEKSPRFLIIDSMSLNAPQQQSGPRAAAVQNINVSVKLLTFVRDESGRRSEDRAENKKSLYALGCWGWWRRTWCTRSSSPGPRIPPCSRPPAATTPPRRPARRQPAKAPTFRAPRTPRGPLRARGTASSIRCWCLRKGRPHRQHFRYRPDAAPRSAGQGDEGAAAGGERDLFQISNTPPVRVAEALKGPEPKCIRSSARASRPRRRHHHSRRPP